MTRPIAALLAVAAAFGVLAAVLLPADPAAAVSTRTAEPITVSASYAASTALGTLAERNAYVRCVAPSSGITYSMRLLMLKVASKALEAIPYYRTGVTPATAIAGLDRLFTINRDEARKAYWCTVRVWG